MTVHDALSNEATGFYIGHRLILPFRCQVIKIIAGREIYTDLFGSQHVGIEQGPKNTSIYFLSGGKLRNYLQDGESIKLIACEFEDDLSDIHNHVKLMCELEEGHNVRIHKPEGDILFIE